MRCVVCCDSLWISWISMEKKDLRLFVYGNKVWVTRLSNSDGMFLMNLLLDLCVSLYSLLCSLGGMVLRINRNVICGFFIVTIEQLPGQLPTLFCLKTYKRLEFWESHFLSSIPTLISRTAFRFNVSFKSWNNVASDRVYQQRTRISHLEDSSRKTWNHTYNYHHRKLADLHFKNSLWEISGAAFATHGL